MPRFSKEEESTILLKCSSVSMEELVRITGRPRGSLWKFFYKRKLKRTQGTYTANQVAKMTGWGRENIQDAAVKLGLGFKDGQTLRLKEQHIFKISIWLAQTAPSRQTKSKETRERIGQHAKKRASEHPGRIKYAPGQVIGCSIIISHAKVKDKIFMDVKCLKTNRTQQISLDGMKRRSSALCRSCSIKIAKEREKAKWDTTQDKSKPTTARSTSMN